MDIMEVLKDLGVFYIASRVATESITAWLKQRRDKDKDASS